MLTELNDRIKDSISLKLVFMGLVAVALIVPLVMIAGFVDDRAKTRDEAAAEIGRSWGDRQSLLGPVVVVPFEETLTPEGSTARTLVRHAYFLPETLRISGAIDPETRYRGIYDVIVYTARLTFSGQFGAPDFSNWSVNPDDIRWDEAFVAFGVTDMRGIKDAVTLTWADGEVNFSSGTDGAVPVVPAGVSARVDVRQGAAFSFDLALDGSRALQFVPVGKTTSVELTSPWPSPSFNGAFLPDERTISDDGFTASWQVLDLNRPYGQQWRDQAGGLFESAFGLSLAVPVDEYRKTMRAVRYAILIIVLTLLAFFIIEVRFRKRAHPFQYLLVGLALCLFYLILLSLSEKMPFNWAYCIGGVATISLIALYVRALFASRPLGLLTTVVLAVLYSFTFTLLQLEDHALLVGSVGLFVLLAITMYLTRNFEQLTTGRKPTAN